MGLANGAKVVAVFGSANLQKGDVRVPRSCGRFVPLMYGMARSEVGRLLIRSCVENLIGRFEDESCDGFGFS